MAEVANTSTLALNIHTIGRRKTSVARIYLRQGSGNITINKRPLAQYFQLETLRNIVVQPLNVIHKNTVGASSEVSAWANFDILVNVNGGGNTGQAEATRMAIARALCELDINNRPALKKEGFLTRDSRMVERKKYGRRKARRRFQFSKR
jgi:small subunit ribosomal protein S9